MTRATRPSSLKEGKCSDSIGETLPQTRSLPGEDCFAHSGQTGQRGQHVVLTLSDVTDHDLVDSGTGEESDFGHDIIDVPDDENLGIEASMALLDGRLRHSACHRPTGLEL